MKTIDRQTVIAFLAENPGIGNREVARRLNCHESFVRRCKGLPVDNVHTTEPIVNVTTKMTTGDRTTVEFETDKLISTEAEALAHAKIDPLVWRVAKCTISNWQVPIKLRIVDAGGLRMSDAPHVKQMSGVKLELLPLIPNAYREATSLLCDRIKSLAPTYRPTHVPLSFRKIESPHLFVVDIFDAHFGKLAWRAETGQDYDLRLASLVYRNAVEDLARYARDFPCERILFPIGNDFYHIDNLDSATTKGTRVDSDGRYAKIIETGEWAIINAIDFLVKLAPVDVVWIPGNHDRIASYHLARTLAAYYRTCPAVTVDCSPKIRKYYRYERNLIGLTHGNREKIDKLPRLMADESPSNWGETTRREWHVGHRHITELTQFGSVTVRKLASLSARDAWHFEEGYDSRRAAEAFVLSADGLTAANFQVSAREG